MSNSSQIIILSYLNISKCKSNLLSDDSEITFGAESKNLIIVHL